MRRASRHPYSAYAVSVISPWGHTALPGTSIPRREHLPRTRRPMADDTEWFEGLATDEAKKERVIIRSWGARAAALAALIFIVAYAMNA